MIIDTRDSSCGRGADVRETSQCSGIGADGAEIRVVERGLGVFVKGRVRAVGLGESGRGGRVPSETEAVDVEEAVARCDFVFCGYGAWGVGE